MVDDEDYEWLNSFKWTALKDTTTYYAARMSSDSGPDRKTVRMHSLIIITEHEIDHIDNNGLNNMRANLRVATRCQNQRNTRKTSLPKSSLFKGVSRQKNRKKWRAGIKVNDSSIDLGSFAVEADAAKAYDDAAKYYFGDFAGLNFPANSIPAPAV